METAPGEKGRVTVSLDTKGRPGRMKRTVEVWTNDPEKKMVILTVSVAAAKENKVENGARSDGNK